MTSRHKSTAAVAIAAGASLSGAANSGDKLLCAIIMPAIWTAAALTFQASDDGGVTWNNVYDDQGNEITIASAAVVAGQRISMDPSNFAGIDFIKVQSGIVGALVNQVAAATLILIYRKYYALD